MVSTRRASMIIPSRLPNEILLQIIQLCPKADQASLSRISKLFHDLCLPILYRVVKFNRPSDAVTWFCSAVIKDPPRADFVRSFTVDFSYEKPLRGDLLLSSLKLMRRLEHLFLSERALDGPQHSILLKKCNFPHLISLDIWSSWRLGKELGSDLVAAFLARHSTLKRVHIRPSTKIDASQSIRVSLPNLEFYEGDAGFILSIVASDLKGAKLTWSDNTDTEKIILGVSSMIKPNVPFVFSHKFRGDYRSNTIFSQIVTSMSRHLRHARTVQLQGVINIFALPNQDTIRRIAECLPRFTGLVYLSLEWMGGLPVSSRPDSTERNVIEGWGEACPTLVGCCLNYYAWRKVNGQWEEFPIKEFRALAGLSG
ncbi:hypothetical protein C8R45DRAFT_1068846, partial [Mycena sanguinolenta]